MRKYRTKIGVDTTNRDIQCLTPGAKRHEFDINSATTGITSNDLPIQQQCRVLMVLSDGDCFVRFGQENDDLSSEDKKGTAIVGGIPYYFAKTQSAQFTKFAAYARDGGSGKIHVHEMWDATEGTE